jgi:hypothetical protein
MVEGLTLPRSAPELVRPDKLEVRVAASGFWPRATFGMVSDRLRYLASYSSMEELADNVARLEGDPRAWRAMQEQPAFNGDALPACAQEDRLFAFWDGIFRDAISGAS